MTAKAGGGRLWGGGMEEKGLRDVENSVVTMAVYKGNKL